MVRRSSAKDPGKLAGVWCGPWTVTSTWGNVVCTIKRVGGDEVRRAHVDQMKPFKCATVTPRQSRRDRQPPPPSAEEQERILRKMRRQSVSDAQSQGSDDGNDEDYEVDSVIGHVGARECCSSPNVCAGVLQTRLLDATLKPNG